MTAVAPDLKDDLLRPGTVVETSYGVGVITEIRREASHGEPASPVVLAKLWRLPGRSIGTAATAYLHPKAILRRLPVAPGMTTTTNEEKPKKMLVHTYIASQQKYLASYADEDDAAAVAAIMPHLAAAANAIADDENDDDDDFFDATEDEEGGEDDIASSILPPVRREPVVLLSYTPQQLNPTKASKFYPLLLELMKRGDRAAAQVEGLWQQNKDKVMEVSATLQQKGQEYGDQVASQTKDYLEPKTIEEEANRATEAAEKAVSEFETNVRDQAPSQEEVRKVVAMLKDEELTVLLENGRQRLEQLISSDIPQATRESFDTLGIKWKEVTTQNDKLTETQQKALSAVDDLLQSVQQAAEAQGINISKDTLSLKDLDFKELESAFHELHLEKKFEVMFDNFLEVSKSDRNLSNIMESVSKHTTEWQQMTGRLLATKSGSLFMEGASRIQARAGMILRGDQNSGTDMRQWTQSMTTQFTKAFTEGDAAVARLKSIELGDAIRKRLVSAIEVRSESLGGLDGIIAGALGVVESNTKKTAKAFKKSMTRDNITALMANLQTSATDKRSEAQETLISVLSSKSLYRDIALLRLERTFCGLEEQFFGAQWNDEDGWSAEDLAKLVRGEGGTAELFEPIAKRAKQEIDKQLDAAEIAVVEQQKAKSGTDPNADMVLEALRRVRKIMSGELTLNAIMDDVVNLLDDDKIVAAGESWIQRGESLLDAIEGVSNVGGGNDSTNRLISDAMQVAKKAGITKDSVMKEFEKINMNEVLDTAQGAVTDEKKRLRLLSQATDAALDFFLRVLPSMPVPPFEGVKDGLVYHLSNLSMEGFKVKKENIMVEIAGMQATTQSKKTRKSKAKTATDVKKAAKKLGPAATAGTALDAPDSNTSLVSDSSMDDSVISQTDSGDLDICTTEKVGNVEATELLIIDISDISATLDGATWSFEQTYFPYLKGSGKSDVRLADASVRLQFELRKRKCKIKTPKSGDSTSEAETQEKEIWEPVLCLHDRSCDIGEVFVTLKGEGKLAWVLNKLADFFKGPLGSYVARQVVAVMSNRSGWILEKLNGVLCPYWDLILSTAGLKMDDLVEADHRVITATDSGEKENQVELVWREKLPLGLNLLLNDESGQVKVVDLPRGSQARKVCEARRLNPDIFRGATIIAVNGCRFFEPDEIYGALRDPVRPKTVLFELAESAEAERVHKFVAGTMSEKEQKIRETATGQKSSEKEEEFSVKKNFETRSFQFTEPGDLGIEFGEPVDSVGLVVCDLLREENGAILAAEQSGMIHEGDLLTHINGKTVIGENGEGRRRAFEILKAEGSIRPLTLTFSDPYLIRKVFEPDVNDTVAKIGGPEELRLEENRDEATGKTRRVVVTGFNDVNGVAESSGIMIGDYLVFVNGMSVGAGARWLGEGPAPSLEEVYDILRDPKQYPMGLTFARPKSNMNDSSQRWSSFLNSGHSGEQVFNDDDAETVTISTERLDLLGCVFDSAEKNNDVIVTDFYAVPGFFQNKISGFIGRRGIRLAVESINGQVVPSYASKGMVLNAMKRSWSKNKRVEVVFSDDDLKEWVHSLARSPAD